MISRRNMNNRLQRFSNSDAASITILKLLLDLLCVQTSDVHYYFLKVCVPKRKRDKILEKPLQYGTVAGWGSTRSIRLGEPTGPLSAELRQVTVPIVPDKECKQATIYKYSQETTLCAGFKKKPKDPCFGDVGSPLVMQHPRSGRWIVIGLFGWSEGCGKPRKYAYYTRVSKYRKWINFIVKGSQ